jgi:hypothetical protein
MVRWKRTLNAMLDAEADRLCGAGRYERSEARQDTRAGSYERTPATSAWEAAGLFVPHLFRCWKHVSYLSIFLERLKTLVLPYVCPDTSTRQIGQKDTSTAPGGAQSANAAAAFRGVMYLGAVPMCLGSPMCLGVCSAAVSAKGQFGTVPSLTEDTEAAATDL